MTTTFAIPTQTEILADFRKCVRRGSDSHDQAIRVVRRWINCGYDIALLPALLSGLTTEVIAAGVAQSVKATNAA